jgi:hypothetical protein
MACGLVYSAIAPAWHAGSPSAGEQDEVEEADKEWEPNQQIVSRVCVDLEVTTSRSEQLISDSSSPSRVSNAILYYRIQVDWPAGSANEPGGGFKCLGPHM